MAPAQIYNFDQTDLNDEDVFVLDVYSQLFVWVGTQATSQEKSEAVEIAQRFITEANDGRDVDSSIVQVLTTEIALLNLTHKSTTRTVTHVNHSLTQYTFTHY